MANEKKRNIKKAAHKILTDAAKTYKQRQEQYGDSYTRVGGVLKALFPDGIPAFTPEEHNRASIINMIAVKLVRYANNFENGGHTDSAHDISVYAAMLEELTDEKR